MKIFDCIGIGFGPANIALAATFAEEQPTVSRLFLEKRDSFVWQEEMLFENALNIHSDIQNIPYRDLATPRSPRSRFTFLNYLHENKRFFSHLNMDMMMPLRPEYAKYIEWCARALSDHVKKNVNVNLISHHKDLDLFEIRSKKQEQWYTKNLVLGHGREPNIPDIFMPAMGENVFHFLQYKSKIQALYQQGARKIAIVGSSQTAAELLLHLTEVYPDVEAHIIMRHFGFPLKDTSPFMSEIYFPGFTELYFKASPALKKRIDKDVYRTNYGAADMDVIEEVYRQIYYDKLHDKNNITLHRLSDITSVDADSKAVTLTLHNHMQGQLLKERYHGIVLATGFKNYGDGKDDLTSPPLLSEVKHLLHMPAGAISVTSSYELETTKDTQCKIFLNGLSEKFHGMGDAGSLSLASLRALTIAQQIEKNPVTDKKTIEPADAS